MKIKKVFGCLAFASVMALGAMMGVKASESRKMKVASATTPDVVFLDNIWIASGSDTAKYWVTLIDNDGELASTNLWMTTATCGLFQVAVPSGYEKVHFYRVAPDVTSFITSGDGFWNNVGEYTIPDDGKNTFKVYNYCTNGEWTTVDNVADGLNIRGKYHGVEDWTKCPTLSNTEVTESFSSSGADATFRYHATLDLHEGDEFKFVYMERGSFVRYLNPHSSANTDATYFGVWNESWGGNLKVFKSGVYTFELGFEKTENDNQYWWHNIDNSASDFASDFLDEINCDGLGVAAPTFDNSHSWSTYATRYNGLDSYAKTVFYDSNTPANHESSNSIEKFLGVYIMVMKNHGTQDFPAFVTNAAGTATRSAANFNLLSPILGNNNYVTAVLVIVISSLSLVCLGGYFLLRKRKEY